MNFSFLNQLTSKKIGLVAFIFWCSSLAFISFSTGFFPRSEHIYGLHILLGGWGGLFVGNFGWFANLFILYGFVQLSRGKTILFSSIFAGLLSLETFRFTSYPNFSGGAPIPIYGYGLGVILWFLAISMLIVAAGTRQKEEREHNGKNCNGLILRPIGLLLIVIVISSSLYLSIHDYEKANLSEQKQLKGLAFKRGKICSAPDPIAVNVLKKFNGTLEVISGDNLSHARYPFSQIKRMLEWGIPRIRVGTNDYILNKDKEVSSLPARNKPSAILYVSEKRDAKGYSTDIIAKLVEFPTQRIIFYEIWKREPYSVNTHIYCPNYHSLPNSEQQPRKLLMDALSLSNNIDKPSLVTPKNTSPRNKFISAEIVSITKGGETHSMERKRLDRDISKENVKLRHHLRVNQSCPLGTGWDGLSSLDKLTMGWPFMINGTAYYPGKQDHYNSLCSDDYVYLYYVVASRTDFHLIIRKRSLSNFQEIWSYSISFPKSISEDDRYKLFKIMSIKNTGNQYLLKLRDQHSGSIIVLKAELNATNHN